jgi:hypothetical protein
MRSATLRDRQAVSPDVFCELAVAQLSDFANGSGRTDVDHGDGTARRGRNGQTPTGGSGGGLIRTLPAASAAPPPVLGPGRPAKGLGPPRRLSAGRATVLLLRGQQTLSMGGNMCNFRGAALAATAVTAVLTLAACGPFGNSAAKGGGTATSPAKTAPAAGGSGSAPAAAALEVVEQRISGLHSAEVESIMSVGGSAAVTSRGSMDWAPTIEALMTIKYTGLTALKNVRVSDTMQARYLPGAYYAGMAPTMPAQLNGKHWIRYGFADLAKSAVGTAVFLKDQARNIDPVRSVRYLMASADLRKVGTETVRGVSATHYTGTLDVAAVTRQMSRTLSAAQLADTQRTLQQAGISKQTYDLWVSAGNLPVKTAIGSETRTGEITWTMYYSDFGVKVRVHAPPTSDYMDFADLTKKAATVS